MSLIWTKFEENTGSATDNFEMVCRSLIRRHYGPYGDFFALANQPGVEFHLKIHTDCAVGQKESWIGWQCRYYDLPRATNIGSGRRKKIEKAIATTEKLLPELTEWILWTKYPLTKSDQKWFYKLNSKMHLRLWNEKELEEHLNGPGTLIRETYFGELILSPETLSNIHKEKTISIRNRWHPDAHQIIDVERVIHQILGEVISWNELEQLALLLDKSSNLFDVEIESFPINFQTEIGNAKIIFSDFSSYILEIYMHLKEGNFDYLQQILANHNPSISKSIWALPRKLRAKNHLLAYKVTNSFADLRDAINLIDKLREYLQISIIAIIAKAGFGKTHLSAQISAETENRPAGILLHGSDLQGGQGLNDVANNQIIVHGKPIPSMEAFLAAVHAAGQRIKCRIPIVIDGLNEAEDPRNWKKILSEVSLLIEKYPNVLLICTIRPDFVDEALPPKIPQVEIPGFGDDIDEAIQRYFSFYKINPTDVALPFDLLNHPLTLRLFCEVSNPDRKDEVGIENIPTSLTALFERYLDMIAGRIGELALRKNRYYIHDVQKAYREIGKILWENRSRRIQEVNLRERLGDMHRPWDVSIVRTLEQEGLILRRYGEKPGDIQVELIYDVLAGHLIADYLLRDLGSKGFEDWITKPKTINLLNGPFSDRHPLYFDIVNSFVGLTPRILYGKQFWQLVDESMMDTALYSAAYLEAALLDKETINQIAIVLTNSPRPGTQDLFNRLWNTRGSKYHPLNADFLDEVLRNMAMADRDVRWSEWVRRYDNKFIHDLEILVCILRELANRTEEDFLRAKWIIWTLTSTVRKLRDQATRSLYWFGRYAPYELLELTLDALEINDPYISERMLAALYGVTMALQNDSGTDFCEEILPLYGTKLYESMFCANAKRSTTHILARDYAKRTIDIALIHHPGLLSDDQREKLTPPFAEGGIRDWQEVEERKSDEYRDGNAPIQMDFENYTIGRLVQDRRNYDYEHEEFIKVRNNIFWRIYELGYSIEVFGEIDKTIARENLRYGRLADGGKTERYGKKYSWIAFYELAGFRIDLGLLSKWYSDDVRISDTDIDPSFPVDVQTFNLIQEDLLGNDQKSTQEWVMSGGFPKIHNYLVMGELLGDVGPWVLLDGYINQTNIELNRKRFVFPRGLIVDKQNENEIVNSLREQNLEGRWLPEIPTDYYTFADEIPWSDTYPYNGKNILSFTVGEKTIDKLVPSIEFYKGEQKLNKNEEEELWNILLEIDMNAHSEVERILNEHEIRIKEVKKLETEVSNETRNYEILLPVRDNNWEDYHSHIIPGRSVSTPAKEITHHLSLSSRPQTFDLFDSSGRKGSVTFQFGDLWYNGHTLTYIRKDLIDKYLAETETALIWVVWGEREYYSPDKFHSSPVDFQRYKVFQEIIKY